MDMDSTLINEEGIDLLAELAGVGEKVTNLTTSAMAGKVDFYSSLRDRVRLLTGHSASLIDKVRESLTFTEGALDLISELKSRAFHIGVVSGGFHEIIDDLLAPLNLDFVRANRFAIRSGFFTGEVLEPIIGPFEKASSLKEFAVSCGVDLSETIAVGDGANDREMIAASGLGVAFCAKPSLNDVADQRIEDRDLRLLLKFL